MKATLSDFLVGLLLITLLGTATMVAAVSEREAANRAKCAANLHQIGLAILLYQQDNQQEFPRTVYAAGDDPVPTWGTPYAGDEKLGPVDGANPFDPKSPAMPKPNDVTAPLMLVMRTEMIASPSFVCPSSPATHFEFGGGAHTALDWTNWPGKAGIADHLSYSFVNLYPSKAAVEAGFNTKLFAATFAVAGDINPGGKDELAATIDAPADRMRLANSANHDRDGQNILFGDGHVEWESDPFCGTEHDNVFTAGGPKGKNRLAATCAGPADSVLLPTTDDVGMPR